MNAHTHGLNNHSHRFTPRGSVSSSGSLFSGLAYGYNDTVLALGRADGDNTVVGGYNEIAPKGYVSKNTANMNFISISSSFTGTDGITGGNSTNTTSVITTGSFTGSTGTTSSTGGGSSFSILPPYLVKYCWERTA